MKNVLTLALITILFAAGAWLLLGSDTHQEGDHHDHDHHAEHDHSYDLAATEPVRADGEFTITTSFYPIQFALERITGDLATVTNIGAGQDPHDYTPSTQDILALQQADLVVLQGAEYEPWGDDVIKQLAEVSVPVVLATAELELRELGEDDHHDKHEDEHTDDHDEHMDEHDHAHGDHDPHTWLDPVLFSQTVEHLTESLVALDPENAEVYASNATTLQAELAELNTQYATTLSNCILEETITSHDAFGYLAERYNFTIHTIAGISTQDTPSIQTLAELREEAEEGVGAILLEENAVAAYTETLASETGLQTLPINPIAYVIPEEENYLSLMQANLSSFNTALDCNG